MQKLAGLGQAPNTCQYYYNASSAFCLSGPPITPLFRCPAGCNLRCPSSPPRQQQPWGRPPSLLRRKPQTPVHGRSTAVCRSLHLHVQHTSNTRAHTHAHTHTRPRTRTHTHSRTKRTRQGRVCDSEQPFALTGTIMTRPASAYTQTQGGNNREDRGKACGRIDGP